VAFNFVAVTHVANAAPSTHSAKVVTTTTKTTVSKKVNAKARTKINSSALAGQTDIVANVDLPMVTNIMPWQEKEGSIPENILEFSKFSALKDYLMTPTDRDGIASEIRYISILNQPVDQK
ncbi:MAG TPA: hypothetical protein VIH30_01670, partial [Aquirhabdus sp.]